MMDKEPRSHPAEIPTGRSTAHSVSKVEFPFLGDPTADMAFSEWLSSRRAVRERLLLGSDRSLYVSLQQNFVCLFVRLAGLV